MKLTEGFILALVAEIGIILIALVFDAEYIDLAIGALLGLLGGYGVAKRKANADKGEGREEASQG